jgi:hypothetical protein
MAVLSTFGSRPADAAVAVAIAAVTLWTFLAVGGESDILIAGLLRPPDPNG